MGGRSRGWAGWGPLEKVELECDGLEAGDAGRRSRANFGKRMAVSIPGRKGRGSCSPRASRVLATVSVHGS